MAFRSRRGAQEAVRGRGGRPSLEQVGEVDVRLLEAAGKLFLEYGFERTSCEEVAMRARAGKASLYARYPNKAALFEASVRFEHQRSLPTRFDVPAHLPVAGRLRAVAEQMLAHAMKPSSLALTRLLIAEGQHLPDVAREAGNVARQHRVAGVAEAMVGHQLHDAGAVARAFPSASLFVDLVMLPQQMRALLGESAEVIAADAGVRIETAIEVLENMKWLSAWR